MTMFSPRTINDTVIGFMESIVVNPTYYRVPIEEYPHGRAGECFFNCRSHNKQTGSSIIFGWAIWDLQGKMLEAEHHAICDHEGQRKCVTPQLDGAKDLLFVEDPLARFDFSDRRSVKESRFLNTSGFRLIDELIAARRNWIRLTKKNMMESGQFTCTENEYHRVNDEIKSLVSRIKRKS